MYKSSLIKGLSYHIGERGQQIPGKNNLFLAFAENSCLRDGSENGRMSTKKRNIIIGRVI